MTQTTTERLRTYLAALPVRSQGLLIREFEKAIARGDNTAVATYVLGELRRIARVDDAPVIARTDDPMRLVFKPFEPFLTDAMSPQPGAVRRSLLLQIWQWLKRDGAPVAVERLTTALQSLTDPARVADRNFAISDFQRAAAIALTTAATAPPSDQKAILARIGPTIVPEDLTQLADLLRAREALDALALKLPPKVKDFTAAHVAMFEAALGHPALQTKSVVPFAMTLAMARLQTPWQIIRLATKIADSDSEFRISSTPYAIAVTMAMQELANVAALLREDFQRGRFSDVSAHLTALHDGVRGLLAEIAFRQDSVWGRQMAALRAEISQTLRVQIDALPARVRRLLRQRSANDITPATRLDATEIEETVAMMEILETSRSYAEELAVNEVSSRARAELAQYVGPTTDAAIDALKTSDARTLAFRRQQAEAAIAFSRVLFGADHAARVQRSADKALAGEAEAKSA